VPARDHQPAASADSGFHLLGAAERRSPLGQDRGTGASGSQESGSHQIRAAQAIQRETHARKRVVARLLYHLAKVADLRFSQWYFQMHICVHLVFLQPPVLGVARAITFE
jgi:hypothetical protein